MPDAANDPLLSAFSDVLTETAKLADYRIAELTRQLAAVTAERDKAIDALRKVYCYGLTAKVTAETHAVLRSLNATGQDWKPAERPAREGLATKGGE